MGGDPHEIAQRAWEDRHGTLATERDRWFRAALASTGLAAVATAFGIWAAVSTEYVPYIIAVDELGRAEAVVAPERIEDWPDVAVRHQIAAFLRDWRSVSTDTEVTRGRLRRVQRFLRRNTAADRKIVAWARDPSTSPFRVAETATVDVRVHSVVALGGNSWLAEWTETRRNRASGAEESSARFQGTLTLGRNTVTDPATLLHNPFGMIVVDHDIVRLGT